MFTSCNVNSGPVSRGVWGGVIPPGPRYNKKLTSLAPFIKSWYDFCIKYSFSRQIQLQPAKSGPTPPPLLLTPSAGPGYFLFFMRRL